MYIKMWLLVNWLIQIVTRLKTCGCKLVKITPNYIVEGIY